MSDSNASSLRSIAALIFLLTLWTSGVSFAKTLYEVGNAAPDAFSAFSAAASTAGYTVARGVPPDPGSADALLISTPVALDTLTSASKAAAAILADGKTVYVCLGAAIDPALGIEPLLPVNIWSAESDQDRRLSSGAVSVDENAFPSQSLNGLLVSQRFDLHLPYAAIESGEHRYRWRQMDKDLLNTDWHVLLTTDQDGRLPLLVEGRNGPGTVVVFGAGIFDPSLAAWSGYAGFVQKLLGLGAATDSSAAPPEASSLLLSFAPAQSSGLSVNITNNGAAAAHVLLAYKVGNAEHQLLNSATKVVDIPAGKTVAAALVERSPELGDAAIQGSGDSALPYRWLHMALATVDRKSVLTDSEDIVDTAPALTMRIDGPDIRFMADKASWPDREIGPIIDESGPMSQYIAPVGSGVGLSVNLRNGLHDIAPLAVASDLGSTDPDAAQGLNDLCFGHGNLRGTLPLYGTWSTKAAPDDTVALTWPSKVLVAGQILYGQTSYRFWDRSNPVNYTLTGSEGLSSATLASVTGGVYTDAMRRDNFAPQAVTRCALHVTGLDPTNQHELGTASLAEWSVLGWAGPTAPPAIRGRLQVTETDPATGVTQSLLDKAVDIASLSEADVPVSVPARSTFGPVTVDAVFTPTGGQAIHERYDLMFVDDHPAIKPNPHSIAGLLCESGFSAMDGFGTGTQDGSAGWVGDENGIWALTHDLMEIGTRSIDQSSRMFTTSVRFSHYSTPWRDFPSGEYYWDSILPKIEELAAAPAAQSAKQANLFLADRWNGIPVGAMFTWADYIAFDQYLRKTTGHGLVGRSREQINKEICANYGDVWQEWQMNRYAEKVIAMQDAVAAKDNGVKLTVTTHGSFPLVGGQLGVLIGKTHVAVGTDAFWELRGEDLYRTLGDRFGLIAANPDFESGAYNEWGYNSSALDNSHWYADVGAVEPSRRQWYSTYFLGRVDSTGSFDPLTVYGFDSEAAMGPKTTDNDMQAYYRVQRLTTRVRPEGPAGFGLVVSWNEQVRHMGKTVGQLGFGLYAAQGYEQLDILGGDVYYRMVKNGVPLSFVASTDTLAHWRGGSPLVLVDGLSYTPEEIAVLTRLNAAGTPLIAIGGGAEATSAASHLFGVRIGSESVSAMDGAVSVSLGGGLVAIETHRPGHGVTIACPSQAGDLGGPESAALAQAVLKACGDPITASPGLAVLPFLNHGRLFLSVCDQGDRNRTVDLSVTPSLLAAGMDAAGCRVVDLDSGEDVPVQSANGALSFSLPMAASDGDMLMIVPESGANSRMRASQ